MPSKIDSTLKELRQIRQSIKTHETKLVLFGGKGGVGKTTNSAATALYLSNTGRRTLVISSDPSPSLSDIFEKDVGAKLTYIKNNLYAMEIECKAAMEAWKQKYKEVVLGAISRFVSLGDGADSIFDKILPDFGEFFAMGEIVNHYHSGQFQNLVWDTPPSGNAIHQLKLPSVFETSATTGARLLNKFSSAAKAIKQLTGKGGSVRDASIAFQRLKEGAQNVRNILIDPGTQFNLVAIPESLSILQTARLMYDLQDEGIRVGKLIVNHVREDNPKCEKCHKDYLSQQKYLKRFKEEFRGLDIVFMKHFAGEIAGLDRLAEFSEELYGK